MNLFPFGSDGEVDLKYVVQVVNKIFLDCLLPNNLDQVIILEYL